MHASHIPELDDLIKRGSPGKRATTLARMTAFFLDGASRFNDDHVRLFDLVFSRLIGEIESTARTELSRRLAPVGKAPIETVRRLAHDDDIAVAGPLLERADRLSDADLAGIAESKGQAHLLAICARNRIAQPVTDVLLRRGGPCASAAGSIMNSPLESVTGSGGTSIPSSSRSRPTEAVTTPLSGTEKPMSRPPGADRKACAAAACASAIRVLMLR